MTTTILTTVGIESCFDTCHIVNKVIDDVVFKQIEKTCVFHKICVAFVMNMTIGRIFAKVKLIHITTVFVLAVYLIGSNRKQKRDTFQCFGIFFD